MSEKVNRIESVKNQFPNVNLNLVLEMDPSKNKKYAMWIAKQVCDGFKIEDIRPTVLSFVKNSERLAKKDIYSYDNLKSLEDALKDLPQSKRALAKFKKENGAEHLGEIDNYKIIYVFEKSGAVFFGAGTRWCITQADSEYFNEYSESNNHFYFLIRNGTEEGTNSEKDPLYKLAVVLKKKEPKESKEKSKTKKEFELEIYNAQDIRVENDILNNKISDKKLLETLKKCVSFCKKDVAKRKDTLAYRFQKTGKINDLELLTYFLSATKDMEKELMEEKNKNDSYLERVKKEFSKITPAEHLEILEVLPKTKKRFVSEIHKLGYTKFVESDING